MKRISKLEGLKLLKKTGLNTISFLENSLPKEIKDGWSIRLSPKNKTFLNVLLPSKHNIKDRKELKGFFDKHKEEYNIITHKTVNPQKIGTVLILKKENKIIWETFDSFVDQKSGKVEESRILELSRNLKNHEKNELIRELREDISKILHILKNHNINLEFVVENSKIIYTDLSTFFDRSG